MLCIISGYLVGGAPQAAGVRVGMAMAVAHEQSDQGPDWLATSLGYG